MEQPMVIEHRDALVYLLNEAAEIEHAICCGYLYAAFSLKESTDEGLEERHLDAIRRWRRVILGIATEEMVHLALVNNLLSSIGAAPRVGRPNMPSSGRYYPPGVQLGLVPFGEAALRHFLFLERPEGITLQDAEGFASLEEAEPLMDPDAIVPRPQDFSTISHLYRSIELGFERLAEKHGEEWLFIGPRRAQATPEMFRWPELVPVADLTSAKQALETIVEMGEGPRGHWKDAHYGRLLVVLGEYLTFKKANPAFEPARPVMPACARQPVDSRAPALVTHPDTKKVIDAFNVAYEVVLYALARFFAHTEESEEEIATLAEVAVNLMIEALAPLGGVLTSMPVGEEHPGATAGPSFEVFHHSGYLLPHRRAAWILMHERLVELRDFVSASVIATADVGPGVVAALDTIAGRLARHLPELAQRLKS